MILSERGSPEQTGQNGVNMKISEIRDYLGAEVLCGEENLGHEVISACCSDMMSDVLAFVKDQGVLITAERYIFVLRGVFVKCAVATVVKCKS